MCKSIRKALPAAAALLIFAMSTNAIAKPTEVEVVNAPDVKVVNTPDVNVVNTADVNVTNKPDVVVANTTPLDVLVTNDSAWREPYHDEKRNPDGSGVYLSAVPTGKRLHVEYLSAWLLIDPGKYLYCQVNVLKDKDENTYNVGGGHDLIMTGNSQAAPGGQLWIASTPISITIDEGEYLEVYCATNDSAPTFHSQITGYLVDMPAQ